MELNVALLAGSLSSVLFVGSMVPMLAKAMRTRDLDSYSLGNLLLANVGNAVHSVYIFSLPMGPIWALHSFYLITSGIMLCLYLHHAIPEGSKTQDPNPVTLHEPGDDSGGMARLPITRFASLGWSWQLRREDQSSLGVVSPR